MDRRAFLPLLPLAAAIPFMGRKTIDDDSPKALSSLQVTQDGQVFHVVGVPQPRLTPQEDRVLRVRDLIVTPDK